MKMGIQRVRKRLDSRLRGNDSGRIQKHMRTKEHFAPDVFKESDSDVLKYALTPQELAFLSGTTAEIIAQLADLDLIAPCARAETPLFQAEAVRQVCKILRMRRHLQISFDSMALIFDLLDRIDALEEQISEMENESHRPLR